MVSAEIESLATESPFFEEANLQIFEKHPQFVAYRLAFNDLGPLSLCLRHLVEALSGTAAVTPDASVLDSLLESDFGVECQTALIGQVKKMMQDWLASDSCQLPKHLVTLLSEPLKYPGSMQIQLDSKEQALENSLLRHFDLSTTELAS